MLSDIDRANMTAKDGVKQAKLEVQPEGFALKTAKWNGPRTAEGKHRIAQARLLFKGMPRGQTCRIHSTASVRRHRSADRDDSRPKDTWL